MLKEILGQKENRDVKVMSESMATWAEEEIQYVCISPADFIFACFTKMLCLFVLRTTIRVLLASVAMMDYQGFKAFPASQVSKERKVQKEDKEY